jgi:hypothetical protein
LHHYPRQDSNKSHKSEENTSTLHQRGADSGTLADADTVGRLATELLRLSPADRERLAALLLGKPDNT